MGIAHLFQLLEILAVFLHFLFLFILIASPIFWVWMLIDVIKYQKKEQEIWILIIALGNVFGALIYYFLARRKRLKVEKNNKNQKRNEEVKKETQWRKR